MKDDINWNFSIQSLENIFKKLGKQKPLIQLLSQYYDECVSCFGNVILKCDLIVKYEEKLIKQLATNEHFTNKEYFVNTMETLNNCKEIRFQQLVSALRASQRKYPRVYLGCQFKRGKLTIYKRDNDFTVKFKKCCDKDLDHISFLVEENGKNCSQKYRVILCYKFIFPFLQHIDSNISDALPFVEKMEICTLFLDIWANLKCPYTYIMLNVLVIQKYWSLLDLNIFWYAKKIQWKKKLNVYYFGLLLQSIEFTKNKIFCNLHCTV
ncbi:hypothetical protein RFI_03529 [Reticulomyxa filosa]|uniref:Uncharacterized protein n=1 Tax=Reticulomyxa filosa TaxID=46433 RepID=X6P628_RETFI|nr:hypothetical protein RFI_03529 [Reticulomyxa filosa]|eukprot:ETO33573.1 hypothetical protein RFI_03529 [Reticulomyxa filosa]